jgi:hypothetical protein
LSVSVVKLAGTRQPKQWAKEWGRVEGKEAFRRGTTSAASDRLAGRW